MARRNVYMVTEIWQNFTKNMAGSDDESMYEGLQSSLLDIIEDRNRAYNTVCIFLFILTFNYLKIICINWIIYNSCTKLSKYSKLNKIHNN